MKLEQQIVSLELANKLKELGVKQDSLFYWFFVDSPSARVNAETHLGYNGYDFPSETTERYSAFTVAELGELLPYRNKRMNTNNDAILYSWKCPIWRVCYKDEDDYEHIVTPIFDDGNEANARAKMLIYLIENKLISL